MPRQRSVQKKSAVLQHPLQKAFQLPCLLLSKSVQETVENLHRRRPKLGVDRLTFGSQFEIGRAPVVRMRNAAHQPSALQPVEHPCHRAWVVRYALAQFACGIRFHTSHAESASPSALDSRMTN